MKRFLNYLLLVSFALLAFSCANKESALNDVTVGGEEIVLNLCPGGEILEVSDEPLSKAGLPDGTLYVVSVYQGSTQYAHGVFDDPSQMSIRLSTGKEFSIQVKAVKDGVSEISHEGAVYSGNGTLDNAFHYYASDTTDDTLYGSTSDVSSLEDQWLLDTYYGALTVTPTAQTDNVNIMLYRMMHKVTVVVSGFEESDGTIDFTQNPYLPGTAAFTLSPASPQYSKLAVIDTDFSAVVSAISGTNDYSRDIAFTAEYSSTINGAPYVKKLLDARSITFRRKRETALTLTISHNYLGGVTASISLTVEGEDMDVDDTNIPVGIDTDSPLPIPEAVDLGLSVKWASFNLGASKPEEYGDYYAWGEVKTKSDYSWPTYKWGTSATSLTKYNTNRSNGTIDNKTVLDPEDDVAHVKLGGSWRMPSDEEWLELINNCTWTWVVNYNSTGVMGLLGTSIIEGYKDKNIFLPATIDVDDEAGYGGYWTNSLNASNPQSAKHVSFVISFSTTLINEEYRYEGGSVRPVFDQNLEGGSGSDTNGAIDLSAGGTANCYIINKAGTYKFNGTVKGNSFESVGDPATAAVIWETFNTSTKPSVGDIISSVSFSNGLVQFTSTGAKGNALIAVKNLSNEILWSWHIWCTDYDPKKEYDLYSGHSETPVMNRNLGATSKTPGEPTTLGFYYHWGRKDPFPSSSSITSYAQMATCPTGVFSEVNTSSSTGTVDYSIKHPTHAISEQSSSHDWLYTSNSTLWSENKTIYDPCPAGWMVPDYSLYDGFVSSSASFSRDTENHGIFFNPPVSSPATFYPAAGTMAGGRLGLEEFAQSCHYWTSSVLGSSFSKRFCVYNNSSPSTSYTSYRSHAFPIRCCKEHAE